MEHERNYSRITIAGTSSGVGKTTISLAIMAALTRRGLVVQGFKVGPDFIDPGYYRMVTGRAGRNLDTWMIGKGNTRASFVSAASGADISVIEGVMGLYDGKGALSEGSTAETAKLIGSPVMLIIDCSRMGSSAGAIALGYLKYDDSLDIKGFILNRIGSDKHEDMAKKSVENATGLPVFGCVRREGMVSLPERHLGLVTQGETGPNDAYVDALAKLAENYIDLEAVVEIAGMSRDDKIGQKLSEIERRLAVPTGRPKARIGVAYDKAFSFYYHDNFDLLKANGAEILFFSPIEDKHIPEGIDGLYLGGGYPEVYADALSENKSIAGEIREAAESGVPVYAECGGLIYLSHAIENFNNKVHKMSGVLPITCKMQNRPTLGYREATANTDTIIARAGDILRGHEFHYSSISAIGGEINPAYMMGNGLKEGFVYKNTLASYIHLHFAGRPEIAERFVLSCAGR